MTPLATGLLRCALPLLGLDAAPPLPTLPPAPPAAAKEEREALAELPNQLASDNFVVKWGSERAIRTEDVEDALAALEEALRVEVEELGHPLPVGSDRYLFNVYIGDTGDGAPSSYGAAGYYYRDGEGFPYLVLAAGTMATGGLENTCAHELYHAIQDATGAYRYAGASAWYWEASAMWIEAEVFPDSPDYYTFLFGFGLLPHLPLWAFDYADTGALEEYHQYGAMVYPRYLSEILGERQLVVDSWVASDGASTPQEALARGLEARGLDPVDVFGAFAGRNALWDYADGEGMAANVDAYERYFRDDAVPVVASVAGETDGLVAAPAASLPQASGANVVEWNHSPGRWRVSVVGAPVGSAGTAAQWRFTLVREGAEGIVYLPLAVDADGAGEVELELVATDEEVLLVAAVGAGADGADVPSGETWGWSYGVAAVEAPSVDDTGSPGEDPEEDPAVACGCGATTTGRGGAVALALALAGLGYRRRPT